MPDAAQLAFEDAKGGMNAADPPHKISSNQLARMVNCAIVEQLPGTRPGVRVIEIEGDGSDAIALGNIQGSEFFNPSKGQGGIVLSEQNAMIAVASGGRKFVVRITGRGARTKGVSEEITSGLITPAQLHLVWWSAWENLLLAQDGRSNCFIWDTVQPAFFSQGYNTINKPRSEVPNGGTVMAYAHGRGICVVNSRFILASDVLHRENQKTSRDLIKFVEQVYWASGKYFLPPSGMGNITAAAILPLRNTQHGHGDTMFHCEDGIFSIDFNVFPRTVWSQSPMVKHALLDCGAVGPYALAIHDGDQIFRTRKGIQTLRSAAAESQLEGNPNQPISNEVDTWLQGDYPRWLRFASLELWDIGRRFFCTTGPIVKGRFRWHRGLVVRNVDPKETEKATPAAWEGLWTLPPEIGGVIQMVSGIFDGEERIFAWCRGEDGRNRLIEFTDYLLADVLPDGSNRQIRSQAITRLIDVGQWYKERQWLTSKMYLRNVRGLVRFAVWVRNSKTPRWTIYRCGSVDVPQDCACLCENAPRSLPIPLGKIPEICPTDDEQGGKVDEGNGIQFLIRWEGRCQIQGLRVFHTTDDMGNDDVVDSKLNVKFSNIAATDYDDFEYAKNKTADWLPTT